MLTPEIIELCKQASVEQDVGKLLYLVSEINRKIEEHRKRFAFTYNPGPENHSQVLKSHPRAEAGQDYALGIESL
jgi:hypothetical protein